jgi:transposase
MQPTIIGLDIAKSVFQVHGVDAAGNTVIVRKLRRSQVEPFFAKLPPCIVALEACASAHHWARTIGALGHDARLVSPQHVKAYVRRNKTDAADAAALCEAASRPHMRFVPVKTPERQAVRSLHTARALLVNQRTRLTNALRAHLAEYGLIAPAGRKGFAALRDRLEQGRLDMPAPLVRALAAQLQPLDVLEGAIAAVEAEILAWRRHSQDSRRLAEVPGIGPIIASALTASLTDPAAFRSARDFAASLGLTPRIDATAGKARLGPISKRGDPYLRRLLIGGAHAVLHTDRAKADPWIARLLAEKPRPKVAAALANKIARTAWVILARNEPYRGGSLIA